MSKRIRYPFFLFVALNSLRGDPVGDYCRDTLRLLLNKFDPNRPLRSKKDFKNLFNLAGCWNVCPEAREAFEEAWGEWKRHKERLKKQAIYQGENNGAD